MPSICADELAALFIETSKRLSSGINDRYWLELRNRRDLKPNASSIREPDARYILCRILAENARRFGIEWPTTWKYGFSGPSLGRARIDLALEPSPDGNGQVNVEFKEGWSTSRTDSKPIGRIQKDFEKMLMEETSGCAFYHILQGPTRKSLSDLLGEYAVENQMSVDRIIERNRIFEKWCLIFFFLKDRGECYWRSFERVSQISSQINDLNTFSCEQI